VRLPFFVLAALWLYLDEAHAWLHKKPDKRGFLSCDIMQHLAEDTIKECSMLAIKSRDAPISTRFVLGKIITHHSMGRTEGGDVY
jgi:hypothetical protein